MAAAGGPLVRICAVSDTSRRRLLARRLVGVMLGLRSIGDTIGNGPIETDGSSDHQIGGALRQVVRPLVNRLSAHAERLSQRTDGPERGNRSLLVHAAM